MTIQVERDPDDPDRINVSIPAYLLEPQRIAIVGGPNTGKTTMADAIAATRPDMRMRHTDDVIDLGWSEASQEVADWLDYPGGLIVEGVAVPRGLRKWLAAHPEGKPVDVVVVLKRQFVTISEGQARMAKGVHTVLDEIEDELLDRGVQIADVANETIRHNVILEGTIHPFPHPVTFED